jgi:hypothetical protein
MSQAGFAGYCLTLTGVPQRLSDVYGDGVSVVNAVHDIPYSSLVFQGAATGANVYIGMANTVSSTNYGLRLDPTTSVPPITIGGYQSGPMKLSDFWVLGTSSQIMSVAGIPF